MMQSEYFGTGSIKSLTDILSNIKPRNIFLVAGKNSYRTSGAEGILGDLLKEYTVTLFNEVSGDPVIESIIKGMDIFLESDCDIVIAVGGGSVIDTAKSINVLSSQEINPRHIIEGKEKIVNKGKPLICLLYTSRCV